MAAVLIPAVGSTIYRFALPTDGWFSAQPDEFDISNGFIYKQNIIGASSGLQPGDHLVGR